MSHAINKLGEVTVHELKFDEPVAVENELLIGIIDKIFKKDIKKSSSVLNGKHFSYIELIPVLCKAIQELETRIAALEASLS